MTENKLITTYSSSHENPTNQLIHMYCVPVIFLNVIAVLYYYLPIYVFAVMVGSSLLFYYRSLRPFLPLMIVLYSVVIFICAIFAPSSYFIPINIVLFVVAWIGQFWGHKIEGKKPSFFQDIFFLLVGPAWVMYKFKTKLLGR